MDDTAMVAGRLLARLDRIPIRTLPRLFAGIIGIGFLFTFYDIFDINVSFIQTCMALVPGCTPPTSAEYIGLPVLLNLAGYVVGTLLLCPLSDRFGRRNLLLFTMILTGIGSALTAAATSYGLFVAARAVTGIGIGADLAIVNTYIGEMAPAGGRARYTSMIFIYSTFGAVAGIWVGLWLTTPPTPLPLGLPFAVAGPHFGYGWRVMYLIGAALGLIGVLLRFQLPESPRWLTWKAHFEEADQVISFMETRADASGALPPVPRHPPAPPRDVEALPFAAIFRSPVYRGRTVLLVIVWLLAYVTLYSYGAGFTTLLSALGYEPPEAGLVAAIGTFGFVLSALVAYAYGENMERKHWMPLAALITIAGGLLIALGGTSAWIAIVGAIILFFDFNVWVPIAYAWSIENYPTRARTTGFALADGVGHLGGGVGLMVIAPLIPRLGVLAAMLLIGGFLVLAAAVAQFGIHTRDRLLDDISP